MSLHLENAKPCPFCGSGRIVKGERYFAMCVDCGATGPERNSDATERKFVGDWNTRFEGQPSVTSPLETEGGAKEQSAPLRRPDSTRSEIIPPADARKTGV